MMSSASTELCKKLGIRVPIFCGAMYPCSNPELVAAASDAGTMAVIQPLSLTYVYGYKLREGIQFIKSRNGGNPLGMNLLIEASSQVYLKRMEEALEVSLEEGIRFFVTALGNPDWVVKKVHAAGGVVFHDVTERKWAEKALKAKVDGLICVSNIAGGHAGRLSPQELYASMKDLGVPLVAAGGVGDPQTFKQMLDLGYAGVQMGTRFIATQECKASDEYKQAILKAKSADIVLTERLTGVPVSVIATERIKREGTHAGWLARMLLKGKKTKHWVRLYYSILSFRSLKQSMVKPISYQDYWQAGKSVEGIDAILPVRDMVRSFEKIL